MADLASLFLPSSMDVDAGDHDPALGQLIEVRLDGRVMNEVVRYNCKAGLVVRLLHDADGNIVADPSGHVVTEELRGCVTVHLRAD
jgi:hypothetical protein